MVLKSVWSLDFILLVPGATKRPEQGVKSAFKIGSGQWGGRRAERDGRGGEEAWGGRAGDRIDRTHCWLGCGHEDTLGSWLECGWWLLPEMGDGWGGGAGDECAHNPPVCPP